MHDTWFDFFRFFLNGLKKEIKGYTSIQNFSHWIRIHNDKFINF